MTKTAKANQFDIQTWIELAESDPEKFETMRAETIERAIQSSSEKRRNHLRRLQWRVDRLRERSATPMAATIELSRLMWDSFYRLHDSYQELVGNSNHRYQSGTLETDRGKSAQIIPFPPVSPH